MRWYGRKDCETQGNDDGATHLCINTWCGERGKEKRKRLQQEQRNLPVPESCVLPSQTLALSKRQFRKQTFFKLLSKSHTTLQQAYLLTISNESKCKPTCAPCPVLFQLRDPPLVLPLVDSNIWKLKLILAHEKSKICKKFSFMSFLVGFHVVSILSQSGRGHPGAIEGNKLFHASFSGLNFLPHTWGW